MAQLVIIDAQRELLVDVIVVKGLGTTEGGAQVRVHVVSTPKGALPALDVDGVGVAHGVDAGAAVDAECEHEVGGGAEEAPAVVDPRMGQEEEALH